MADWGEAEVRGRCGCGRRYRILHAKPDQVVTCPNCGRGIIVTRADLKAAGAGEMLIPLQPEQVEVREALLVDEVELRPAPAGSGPGLTGRQVHTHEVALLAEALEPSRQIVHGAGAYSPGAPRSQPAAGAPVRPAAFLLDMLASFWFAGRPRNALVLAITALVFTVPLLILGRPVIGYVVFLLTALLEFLLFLHALQFFWHVMTETAMGEDDLPVVPRGWDWIEDALKPLGWLLLITLLCSVPAIAAGWYAPPGQYREPLIWAAVLLGTFVWPIALLSVALANGRVLLRPDLLVRSVWGIGPAYIAAWFLVLALVAAIVIFVGVGPAAMGWPAVVATVYPIATGAMVFYLAYVLFRTLGLLFRHFGGRLPWRV
ncbi:MAG: hypothetical protein KBH81_11945 [Phycisphaerae bacterium]|jgi:hypothetical protein|nr:hypothetical protein [Phycisphaerae bacterium]HOO16108.1 hypothetical protein [Phycisphaerae bacterium]HPC22352.1 hypothetical protein [Phycisphaerae bacterium]HRS27753.1 hypothetical protein [Phycisphaerae bacterium]HRT41682.1 hypothetical protein [Phycisphaerae bacterium]